MQPQAFLQRARVWRRRKEPLPSSAGRQQPIPSLDHNRRPLLQPAQHHKRGGPCARRKARRWVRRSPHTHTCARALGCAHTTTVPKSSTAAARAFERRGRAPPARGGPIAACFRVKQPQAPGHVAQAAPHWTRRWPRQRRSFIVSFHQVATRARKDARLSLLYRYERASVRGTRERRAVSTPFQQLKASAPGRCEAAQFTSSGRTEPAPSEPERETEMSTGGRRLAQTASAACTLLLRKAASSSGSTLGLASKAGYACWLRL